MSLSGSEKVRKSIRRRRQSVVYLVTLADKMLLKKLEGSCYCGHMQLSRFQLRYT